MEGQTQLRVLFVTGGALDRGGITAVMLHYLRYIDINKVRIDILVHGLQQGEREAEAISLGARVFHVPHKIPHYLKNRRAILQVMRAGGYDIVHAHMDGMNGYILKLAKKAGVPRRISHCHNTAFLTTDPLRVLLHRRAANASPRYATGMLACSEKAARFLYGDRLVDEGRTTVLKNAIALDAFRFSPADRARVRAEHKLGGRFAVGCVGRYDYQKNQLFLLDAFAEAAALRPDAVLLLVGDGVDRPAIEARIAALGLHDRVLLTGYRGDIPAVLSALDLVVMPSRFEGLGIALIEAQACGLPCLASDAVPRDTCVTDCRYLPLADAHAWAEAIAAAAPVAEGARAQDTAKFAAAGYDIAREAEKLTAYYFMQARPRVLFISNIPAPYRVDFYNALSTACDLTVLFEARRAKGVRFNWNEAAATFRAVFLSDGDIDETHVDRRVFRYIRRGAYDRIVATNYGYYTETAALAKMRLLGIPYGLELDGGVLRPGENPVKRLVKRWIIRGASHLFSTGAATDALFLHYGADRARIVRYPFSSVHESEVAARVPTAAEKEAERQALSLRGRRVALYAGQFISRKGVDVLIGACAQPAFPKDTGVYLIGDKPPADYMDMVLTGRLENVHFRPFLEKDVLFRWLRAADVFVLPTREDVWGLVVNEAMACGLPVVTTTACVAGAELVQNGKNGFLVPPNDEQALAEAVARVLQDDDTLLRLSQNALETARAYTIERMAARHVEIFRAGR